MDMEKTTNIPICYPLTDTGHNFLDLYFEDGHAYVYSSGRAQIESDVDNLKIVKEEYCRILKKLYSSQKQEGNFNISDFDTSEKN
jgi:hypothetical protein